MGGAERTDAAVVLAKDRSIGVRHTGLADWVAGPIGSTCGNGELVLLKGRGDGLVTCLLAASSVVQGANPSALLSDGRLQAVGNVDEYGSNPQPTLMPLK